LKKKRGKETITAEFKENFALIFRQLRLVAGEKRGEGRAGGVISYFNAEKEKKGRMRLYVVDLWRPELLTPRLNNRRRIKKKKEGELRKNVFQIRLTAIISEREKKGGQH